MERLIRSSAISSEALTRLPSSFSSYRLPPSSARCRLSSGAYRPSPSPSRDLLPPRLLTHRDASLSSKNSSNFAVKAARSGRPPAEFRPDAACRDERAPAEAPRRFSLDFVRKASKAGTVALLSALILLLIQPGFTPPAFATIQTATKTGSSAVSSVVRTELLSSAWTGFFAGCLHTLSGPDHLAALAPLSIGRTRIESAAVGALWGCGHDAGQMIFGLLFLLLKDRLHIEIIRTWGTRVVGMTLLVIGAMGIREATEVPTPCVVLENGECIAEAIETTGGKKKIGLATFATGIVHGLQPDALVMVLPALALPSRLAGAAFLGMFLVGTVVAMGSYTVFIGSCSRALKDRVPRITEKLTWASSLVAIALGVAIIVSQLFGLSLY